jgi:hypothetical protein
VQIVWQRWELLQSSNSPIVILDTPTELSLALLSDAQGVMFVREYVFFFSLVTKKIIVTINV